MLIKGLPKSKLDAEIDALLLELEQAEKDSEKYGTIHGRLSQLYKLRIEERSRRVSPDTMLVVAANIFGILWLARFERDHVIKSREAMKMVFRPR